MVGSNRSLWIAGIALWAAAGCVSSVSHTVSSQSAAATASAGPCTVILTCTNGTDTDWQDLTTETGLCDDGTCNCYNKHEDDNGTSCDAVCARETPETPYCSSVAVSGPPKPIAVAARSL
jgi:hypothetical protein